MLTRDGILLSDFPISNDVLGGTLWLRLNMEISKSAVLLANEHQSDQKKKFKMIFVLIFTMYSFTQKTTLSMECQKM